MVVMLIICLVGAFIFQATRSRAAVGTVYPDSDVTKLWPSCTGTGCATNHYTAIDESVLSTADYVNTGTSGVGGEEEEYTMGTVAGASATVTQIAVKFQAQITTAASSADAVDVRIFIDGAYQTAQQSVLSTTSTLYTTTFTGTWSGDDDLQVEFVRVMNGTGPSTGRDDDIRLYQVYAEVTYANPSVINQSAYRFFENNNSASVSTVLAATNTAVTISNSNARESFRLRLLLDISSSMLNAGGQSFKLQYVGKGTGSCASPSGGTPSSYTDVTATTHISFKHNATMTDATAATANASLDPVHSSHTNVMQTYEEANNFTNAANIPAGQDGLWDFPLVVRSDAPTNTTYCLRVAKSDGSALDGYTVYPEVTTDRAYNASTILTATSGGSGTFGKTAVGLTQWTPGAGLWLIKYSLSEAGYITSLKCYCQWDGNGATNNFGVIYSDSSGPSTLMAKTIKTPINSTTAQWWTLPFRMPVYLTAGDYWLGINMQEAGTYTYFDNGAANQSAYADNTLWSQGGPYDPMSSFTFESKAASIYAEYNKDNVLSSGTTYTYRVTVDHPTDITSLGSVKLRLANQNDSTAPYNDLEFTWTESTDSFSETGTDTSGVATLSSSGTDSTCTTTRCTLDFKLTLTGSFAALNTNYDAQLFTQADDASTDDDVLTSIFQVAGGSPTQPTADQRLKSGNWWLNEVRQAISLE